MTPKQILEIWIEAFNNADAESISNLYSNDAINHQVANAPVPDEPLAFIQNCIAAHRVR